MKNKFSLPQLFFGASLLLVSIGFFGLESCKKQITTNQNIHPSGNIPTSLSKLVNATITGYVILEDGSPAAHAKVIVGDRITTTNSEGYFSSGLTKVPEKHAFVKVNLDGYYTGMRTLYVSENSTEIIRIRLMKEEEAGTFPASSGGTIQAIGGGSIIFSPNSVVNEESGDSYNGTVHVFAKRINPLGEYLDELMPGTLRGITRNGVEQALISYGMLAVELKADDGTPLQLAAGTEAELKMPVEAAQTDAAPQSVPMWYMNEENGMWQEEGTFQLAGAEYVGKVKHFSFWNVDVGISLVNYKVRIYDSVTNTPLMNYNVRVSVGNSMSSTGYTNPSGEVSGGIPANSNCTVEVLYSCNQNWVVLKSWNIVTGNNSIDDGVKKVLLSNVVNYSTITGSVLGCNGNVLSGAYLRITQNGIPNTVYADVNGNFTYTVPSCGTQINFEVIAIDSANNKCSQPLKVSLGAGIHPLGVFNACSQQGEYFKVTQQYNGTVTQYSIPMVNSNLTCFRQGNFLTFNAASLSLPLGFNGMIWGAENTTSAHTLAIYNENTPTTLSGTSIVVNAPVVFSYYGGSLDYVEGSFKVIYNAPFTNLSTGIEFRLKRTN